MQFLHLIYNESSKSNSDERIVFELLKDKVAPEAVIPVPETRTYWLCPSLLKQMLLSVVSPVKHVDFTFTAKAAEAKSSTAKSN
jgi:hypothetical protein